MLEVITMSSKGQLVIPREIREEMRLEKQDKFVVVHDKDNILLKRISREEAAKAMLKLMDSISDKFRKAGIKRQDIAKEIRKVRAS
ncbi:MAG: AbrB/MazE/SpoVT family DNA-binding domain-containing protein [Nanoarchaeota archaeon]